MSEDGVVIIGTKLDSKQLEKDIKSAESRLKSYEKEGEKLAQQKSKIDLDLSAYDEQKKKIQESTDEILKQAQTEEQVNEVLSQESIALEKLNNEYAGVFDKQNQINSKIIENQRNQELVNQEISDMKQKLKQVKGFNGIKDNINEIGNSIDKTVKKVAKWALAVFGIRSAYNAVRSAMSTLTQYDDQMASNIEYIRYALANTLKPVIEGLINLVYKLLTYVNYLAKAWFGVDLFANASAKAFKKAKDGVSGTAKEAQKLSKQLAGFDEMNIIQKDGSTSTGGGGGGTPVPSFDLAAPEDVPIPSWLQWLADNGNTVKDILIGIGLAIAGIKIAGLLNDFGLLGEGLSKLDATIMGLGIGIALFGIYETIKAIVEFIKDPSWENFSDILIGLTIALTGAAIAMIAFNAANPIGWIALAVAAVVGLVAVIIKYWDEIKAVLGKVWSWIYDNVIKPIGKIFSGLWETIKKIFTPVINFFKSIFTTVFTNIKIILGNIGKIFSALWSGIKAVFKPVATFFKEIFSKASTAIKNVFNPIVNFFSGIWSKIKGKLKDFGASVGEVIGGAFKGVINGVLKAIETVLNTPIKALNGLIGAINKIPGVSFDKLKEFKLPRLAKGGIVNYPGPGVPIGGAIAGEKGKEFVMPLEDSQMLSMVGEAIGKYITINANITNTMNGRVISRELQKINNSRNFATNS